MIGDITSTSNAIQQNCAALYPGYGIVDWLNYEACIYSEGISELAATTVTQSVQAPTYQVAAPIAPTGNMPTDAQYQAVLDSPVLQTQQAIRDVVANTPVPPTTASWIPWAVGAVVAVMLIRG